MRSTHKRRNLTQNNVLNTDDNLDTTAEAVQKACRIISARLIPMAVQERYSLLLIHLKHGNGRMSRLLTTLLLYRSGFYVGKFEDRFALVETKLPALETVRRATMNKIGRFSKQDIRELCPSLSISSIEGALRKLVAEGEIQREGNGKNIRYFRLK